LHRDERFIQGFLHFSEILDEDDEAKIQKFSTKKKSIYGNEFSREWRDFTPSELIENINSFLMVIFLKISSRGIISDGWTPL
jgi:hypothetical protein